MTAYRDIDIGESYVASDNQVTRKQIVLVRMNLGGSP